MAFHTRYLPSRQCVTFSSYGEGNSWLKVDIVPRVWLLVVVVSALWVVCVSATGSDYLELDFEDEVDTTPWISSRKPGRFLLQNREGWGWGWGWGSGQNFCRTGRWNERGPNFGCRFIMPYPWFRNPQCCVTRNNNRRCFDVGGDDDNRCGSCTRSCPGTTCCGGVCVNLMTDSFNCGRCGHRCHRRVRCQQGMCGYGM